MSLMQNWASGVVTVEASIPGVIAELLALDMKSDLASGTFGGSATKQETSLKNKDLSEGVQAMAEATVDFLLARRQLLDDAIERKLLEEERFGSDTDYENGTILVFDVTYGSTTYTYVALKVKNGRWYTTANVESRRVMTWSQLMTLLGQAEGVWIVTKLEAI